MPENDTTRHGLPSPEFVRRMLAIANGRCREFSVELVEKVQAEGGSATDVAILLSAVIATCLELCVPPERREAVVQQIAAKALLRPKGRKSH